MFSTGRIASLSLILCLLAATHVSQAPQAQIRDLDAGEQTRAFSITPFQQFNLTQMVTDHERPYIYAVDLDGEMSRLLFINTDSEIVEKILPIGSNVTDMSISQGEGLLYVTNWIDTVTRRVDLETQQEIAPLNLGNDVYKINAGAPGRIYTEEQNQWIDVSIIDSSTGTELYDFNEREGDAEIDPTGRYYYHCDNNSSAANITKWDVSGDVAVSLANSLTHAYGSRNLLMSADGSRLFWRGFVYDTDLNELGYLGEEIHATSMHGDLAFSSTRAYDAHSGEAVFDLPFTTDVLRFSGDQSKLFMFKPSSGEIVVIPTADIAEIPDAGPNPSPADGAVLSLPLGGLDWETSPLAIGYEVYFGTDAAAVAAATIGSPEYLGQTEESFFDPGVTLDLGETYYWRVDRIWFSGTVPGPVWEFRVAPIVVAPNELSVVTVTGTTPVQRTLALTADAMAIAWSVEETIPWLSLSSPSGVTPDNLMVTFDPTGLDSGVYRDTLSFAAGGQQFDVPVEFELIEMELTQMLVDHERPYIYGLHAGSGTTDDAFLVFINTETELVEKVISIGSNPTDMSINYGEGMLYVTNWLRTFTRRVDLAAQEQVAPLELGTDVYKINAGLPGRIYVEEEDQWIAVSIIDSITGDALTSFGEREGDAEIDPTGRYYYHCDNNSSAAKITKWDVTQDGAQVVANSLVHAYGSRNLVMSPDGVRLFWRGYVYDADLNELGYLGDEIYATSLHGDLAISSTQVYNSHNGNALFDLPFQTSVLELSGDQSKLFLYDPLLAQLVVIPSEQIADIPGAGLNPTPADEEIISLPLESLDWDTSPLAIGYDVYFGSSQAAVAAASSGSTEFLGQVIDSSIVLVTPLELAQTYYWRVDQVGFSGTAVGPVWSFTVAPLTVAPQSVEVTTVTGTLPVQRALEVTAGALPVSWSATESIPWLTLSTAGGATPDTLNLTLDPSGLEAGIYTGAVEIASDGQSFEVPITFELFQMELTKMVVDHERPYIYGLHRGSGLTDDAFLLFINTESEQVEKVIPIGSNPTDMSINYGEGLLYVSNWQRAFTRRVDLSAREQIAPLELGTDVFKINAGRPGRIYTEEEDQWVDVNIIDSVTGVLLGDFFEREGDGEVDPVGNFYYHCDNNSSGARLSKWDISSDTAVKLTDSPVHAYGSRNLVMSGDGSRLFWRGYVYDADLNELGWLADEIYATSLHGDLAFSSTEVYNSHNHVSIFDLPFTTNVMQLSGDQSKLFLFDPGAATIVVIPTEQIADIPGAGMNPSPADGETISLPLAGLDWDTSPLAIGYELYFGSDAAHVGSAIPGSSEHLGSVSESFFDLDLPLELGATYYWRVDQVGFTGTVVGAVWSFSVAPLVVSPNAVAVSTVTGELPVEQTLALTAGTTPVNWTVIETLSWLSVSVGAGSTPDDLVLTLDPTGLAAGGYSGVIEIDADGYVFEVPVEFEVVQLELTQMLTDHARPYVYGLHRGSGTEGDAFLLFIHTGTEAIEKVLPVGKNATDMTINYGEGLLYISNWKHDATRRVDLASREQIAPLALGIDVFKINAGAPGRVYTEGEDQWIDVDIIDTTNGMELSDFHEREGDGEVEPTGTYYYHCDNNSSAAKITKWDVSSDVANAVADSLKHAYGSRNLVMSADGSRLFWRGFIYDVDLNELGSLGNEIYATSLHGDLAVGATEVYNAQTGASIFDLPVESTIMQFSGDQSKLFLYDTELDQIVVIPVSTIADIPGPGLNPKPANGETISLPLAGLDWDLSPLAIGYDVYFGADPAAVAAASVGSPEHLGSFSESFVEIPQPLMLGATYYWRVDSMGFGGTVEGVVWSFNVAPLTVSPNRIDVVMVTGNVSLQRTLQLSADSTPVDWSVSESIPWLTLSGSEGTTPDNLILTLDPTGLEAGVYSDSLQFTSGALVFEVPVTFELFDIELTKLLTDRQRPYIYGLHRGSGGVDDAFLVFINTDSATVEKVIPIGSNSTDMSINYSEGLLYVTNWLRPFTRRVDLATQEQLSPLELGNDVYKINAGIPGRIYTEEEDQWIVVRTVDSVTGATLASIGEREGDAEVDPGGAYYYHADNNISNARISRWNVSGDGYSPAGESPVHAYGSRNLLMSGDGSRLFWQGFIYDADLNELGWLGQHVYASDSAGRLAFTAEAIFDTDEIKLISLLPEESEVMAVSNDDSTLYLFGESSGQLLVFPLDPDGDGEIADSDNCPNIANPDQADGDGDQRGDVCDNCFSVPNADQADFDADGLGDVCDICPMNADPDQDDSDNDGVGSACDNCPEMANPGQEDVIHPNGVGDLCDDPDGDTVYDIVDNCADVANADQSDDDLDGTGDVCDICPTVANPDQDDAVGCLAVTTDGGQCLEATIELVSEQIDGTVTILESVELIPEQMFFEVEATSCAPGSTLSLTLNGTLLATAILDPDLTCTCPVPPQSIVVSDAALIASAWNAAGVNQLLIDKVGNTAPVAWVRVRMEAPMATHTQCLYDYGGGDCTIENVCAAQYTIDPFMEQVEMESLVGATGLVAEIPFQGSMLPQLIDIAPMGSGAGALCVDDGVDQICEPIFKQGEQDLAINGAACGPPTAVATTVAFAECSSPAGATVSLDGSASSDPNSSPQSNDDILSFDWFTDFGLPSESFLGAGQWLEATLPLGEHSVTLRVTDSFGNVDTDGLSLAVVDTSPPAISVELDPSLIWPPDHTMRDILATVSIEDVCGGSSVVLSSVTSNEPDNAASGGDGNTVDDIQDIEPGTADFEFKLRAERLGSGDGRVYTVVYTGTDDLGNDISHSGTVVVPHDMGDNTEMRGPTRAGSERESLARGSGVASSEFSDER